MRVAVVFYGLTPHGGGVFTFQQSLMDTLRALGSESHHDFVFYSAGTPSQDPGVIDIPVTLPAAMRKRAIEVSRAVQDRFNMQRISRRTWFERSLDERGVDMVWFAANYADECDRPGRAFQEVTDKHVGSPAADGRSSLGFASNVK